MIGELKGSIQNMVAQGTARTHTHTHTHTTTHTHAQAAMMLERLETDRAAITSTSHQVNHKLETSVQKLETKLTYQQITMDMDKSKTVELNRNVANLMDGTGSRSESNALIGIIDWKLVMISDFIAKVKTIENSGSENNAFENGPERVLPGIKEMLKSVCRSTDENWAGRLRG